MKINMIEYDSMMKKLNEIDRGNIEMLPGLSQDDLLERYKNACEILKIKYIPIRIILEGQPSEIKNRISKKQIQSLLIFKLSDEYSKLVLNFDSPPEFEMSEQKVQELLQKKLSYDQRKILESKLDLCQDLEKRKKWRKALALVLFNKQEIDASEYIKYSNPTHQYVLTSEYSLEGLEYIWPILEFRMEILDEVDFHGQDFKIYWDAIYEKIRIRSVDIK